MRKLVQRLSIFGLLSMSLSLGCALHANRHRLDGRILALSQDARTLELTGRGGQRVSVVLSEKTEYRRDDSHKASLGDLKAGADAIVVYDLKDGVNKAVEVHLPSVHR